MERLPLISVVIPAYNRSATIIDCLRSVERQTYQRWEAIAVDDGSTDGTADLIAGLAGRDNRFRLVRQNRNRGAQAARNVGIRAARGEWIAFLDSDDQFFPYSLEARLEVAIREGVSVVHSECNVLQADGTQKLHGVPALRGRVYCRLLEAEGPVFPALLVSKKALERIGYLDERIVAFQEWDTVIRLAKHFPFGFESRPTFTYDCRRPDTISKEMRRGGIGYEQVFQKHFLGILRFVGPRALARHYRLAAKWYRAGEDLVNERRCHLKALFWSSLGPVGVLRRLVPPFGVR